ncbi:hypothetical protein GJAV_G00158030 [Gymnothorax javanicus]|nr:hypothetical protein GJAV_G00158030 [Gymnothorax javanicus]
MTGKVGTLYFLDQSFQTGLSANELGEVLQFFGGRIVELISTLSTNFRERGGIRIFVHHVLATPCHGLQRRNQTQTQDKPLDTRNKG